MRIVFMGTPEFSVPALHALARAHEVIAVYTQPDRQSGRGMEWKPTPVKVAALERSIPVYQPAKLRDPGVFADLVALNPDVIVVVAYGQLLKQNILALPRYGCINIHASLLPRWRGAAPIHRAILAGDTVTGITTMKMVEKLDAGDMLLKSETPISPSDTVSTLHDRLAGLGADLILKTLQGLQNGSIESVTQEEQLVTVASKLTKEMEQMDIQASARQLDRQIRALNPWPGTRLNFVVDREQGLIESLKIMSATLVGIPLSEEPGQIVVRDEQLVLVCGDGYLILEKVQSQGKRPLSGKEWINGWKGQGKQFPIRVKGID